MVFTLAAKLDPCTVNIAEAVPLEPDSAALPRVVLPSEKVTLPVGKDAPLTAFTVAVSCVDAVDAMAAGEATTDVVVVAGALTATVVEALELKKFPVAV